MQAHYFLHDLREATYHTTQTVFMLLLGVGSQYPDTFDN